MKISDFLAPTAVFFDIEASNKNMLLHKLSRKAAEILSLPADDIAAALLKREDIGSTATGGGVAIPHANIEAVIKPFGLLAKLRHPIDFEAIDGRSVDIIFAILQPTKAEVTHLEALASVARKLSARETLLELRRAQNPAQLYSAMVGTKADPPVH